MASVTNQKNTDPAVDIDLEDQTLKVVVEEVKAKMEDEEIPKGEDSVVTDIIVILDESGSMISMGDEPVQSANAFIQEQRKNADDDATITLVTFSIESTRVIDDQLLSEVKDLSDDLYSPGGSTALNDAVCATIDHKIESEKSDNVILLIITDGEENSSRRFSTADTRKRIEKVQKDHDWKVIFIGANIDAFAEGNNLSVDRGRCAQYDQNIYGNLLYLMRSTSKQVSDYRRARSDGDREADLKTPHMNINKRERRHRSYPQTPTNRMIMSPPLHSLSPPALTRTLTRAGL